jgi:hypothetical protein
MFTSTIRKKTRVSHASLSSDDDADLQFSGPNLFDVDGPFGI